MGNSRRFKPGRQARRFSLKDQLRQARAENEYYRSYAEAVQAQLTASRMERPADLDEWIDQVALPAMDEEERQAWDAMDDDEREHFKDELGTQIRATELLSKD